MSPRAAPAGDATAGAVAFLRDPRTHAGARVEVIETHLSWLFLTPTRVYKLKKAVRHPFVDLSTVAARGRNCEAELRLNRVLAPSVYLDVVALRRQRDGSLALGGRSGPVVDWAVKMRRLPESHCLEWQVRCRTVDRRELSLAARRLACFHRDAPLYGPADPAQLRARLGAQAAELGTLLRVGTGADAPAGPTAATAAVAGSGSGSPSGGPAADVDATAQTGAHAVTVLHEALLERLNLVAGELTRRPRREVHGDLRPQHVYLGPDPVFIDRLEFSLELRLLDPLEEQAFLAMECALLGAPAVGRQFRLSYRAVTGDRPAKGLWGFYTARRALTWAVLAARHVPRGGEAAHWFAVAGGYVRHGLAALDVAAVHGAR